MNAPSGLSTDLTTRDALRLLNVMVDRLHAAADAAERDLEDERSRGASVDDRR